jgi:hypothetical protein
VDLLDYQRGVMESGARLGGYAAVPLAVCDLTAAAGAVASTVAGRRDGSVTEPRFRDLMNQQLGDLLCSVATLATADLLDLDEVAVTSLAALEDLYGHGVDESCWSALPTLDADFPDVERFPRQLVIEFRQHIDACGLRVVHAILRSAIPNPFAAGPCAGGAGRRGFQVGGPLGDPLTDNARRPDGYRFHDAIHFGFLAVLGWSPNLRALLRLKRKSDPVVDECEDGARAVFAEEGLAAVLARLAETHDGFRTLRSVTRDAVEMARAATVGLEVYTVPGWLWRRAVWQGFRAMHQLVANGGGRLVADLDARSLTHLPAIARPSATASPQAA